MAIHSLRWELEFLVRLADKITYLCFCFNSVIPAEPKREPESSSKNNNYLHLIQFQRAPNLLESSAAMNGNIHVLPSGMMAKVMSAHGCAIITDTSKILP